MACSCSSNGIGSLIDPGPFTQTVERPMGTGPIMGSTGFIDPGPFQQIVDRPVGTGPPIASNGSIAVQPPPGGYNTWEPPGGTATLPNHPSGTIIPDTREGMFSGILGGDLLGTSVSMGGMEIPILAIVAVGAYLVFFRGRR